VNIETNTVKNAVLKYLNHQDTRQMMNVVEERLKCFKLNIHAPNLYKISFLKFLEL
jgi:hypothetical protein